MRVEGRQALPHAPPTSGAAVRLRVTFAEHVAAEDASDQKHQLVDGEVFAMARGRPVHAWPAVAVGRVHDSQLRDRPCQPHTLAVPAPPHPPSSVRRRAASHEGRLGHPPPRPRP